MLVVGGVVSIVNDSLTFVVLPATSVAVKVKVHAPSFVCPVVSIPEGKGFQVQGFPADVDVPG
jgi:hypothetical protein